jgi:threonylcarbamoyladenosine tRNA methylthiotransferase MtaB
MHEGSVALIEQCDIVMGHIFPFSPKRGTPAARMPQVAPAVVKQRARRLREACAERKAAWLQSLIGTTQRVLVEKDGIGHAENFAPVEIRETVPHPRESGGSASSAERASEEKKRDSRFRGNDGGIISATIISVRGDALVGIPA